MDLAKVRGCLAVSILPILLLVDPTAACYCRHMPPVPLATAFCVDNVVLKGSFVGAGFPNGDRTWVVYDFIITQMFKGTSSMGRLVKLHSQMLGTTCVYQHPVPFGDEEYLVVGYFDVDGHIIISECSFIKRWSALTPDDHVALNLRFTGCN